VTNRSDLRGTSLIDGQKPAPRVDRERLADERGGARSSKVAFEPLRPGIELGGRRPTRPQRGIDLKDGVRGYGRQLRGPQQILGQRPPPSGERHFGLAFDRLGRGANVLSADLSLTQGVERHVRLTKTARRRHEVGPAAPKRVVARRVELHGVSVCHRGARDKKAHVNRYDFDGRVALVTGGASGIGAATAKRLRESGAQVAVFDRQQAEGDVLAIQGDVSQAADADAAVNRVVDELGRFDVLVNSAGVPGQSLRTLDVTDEEWERVFAINAHGTFWFCRAASRVMVERGYGRIVNVASIAGKEGNPQAAAYSGSKAAVIGFTKSIGKDLAGTGVLVNCIAPAVVDTPILEGITPEHIDYMVERIPLGRLGRPEEPAALICWLASEEMTFSTGACYDISGGRAVY
jgi:2-dehydro-3-deoxy-L-rhamnonate dehydrogenase (NAD+)